ncbi:two-component regulator propeller domain-containing protein [Pricia sp.]|uniref:two-component regulator propeller domain-containing protein n=1 Tax=Pricia sp. TaxID=2268138 RepID=UPI0035931ACC
MKKALTVLFLSFLAPLFLSGQQFYFRHYQVEDGLSHNSILSSLQDEKGFMWFGTKDGLNRFDGYTFKVFRNDRGNQNSLGSNFVECLHEYNGDLWVGTDSGVFLYNAKLENFEALDALGNFPILDIENDDEGNLWFVAGNTLSKYNVASKKLTRFDTGDFFPVEEITKTPDGILWAANANFIYRYDRKNDTFKTIEILAESDNGLPLRISKISPLNENTLLIGTQNHGALRFDISSEIAEKLLPESEDPLYVRDFAVKDKELWMATESGLYIYDLKNGTYENLKKSYNDPYALSDNALYTLTIDTENGVWIGSYFGGIDHYPKPYAQFDTYFPKTGENSISGNAVREIKKDTFGNLWIGTEDAGLNRLNLKSKQFTGYMPSDDGHTLSHYNIHALLPRGDQLWVGTFEHGLDIMDLTTGEVIKHYRLGDGHGLSSNFIYALYEDGAQTIYAVTASGIQTYDPEKDRFDIVDGFPPTLFFTALMKDVEGVLWAGSYWDGLYTFDLKTNKKRMFRNDDRKPNAISANGINAIFQDSKRNIWVTTENGLNRYRKESEDFRTYTTQDGFPSNVFYSIIEDAKNRLWISTSNGLIAFDPETEEKKVYTKANGLLSDQFNYNSAYKADNGRMYFGSVGGLISFDPDEFMENTYSPPIFITGLQINNREVSIDPSGSPLQESVIQTSKIQLGPNESSFNIDFAALGFNAPETREYWYKLEGLDDAWIDLNKKHNVSFTQLPAGDYTFKVKSLNNNGVWSKEASPLQIEVLPVLWKSHLAYALYIIIFGILIYLGFREYHRRIKVSNLQRIKQLNHRKEKEVYRAKIEFFTNISHEIRTPLTLIKSPLEKAMDKIKGDPGIFENLSIVERNTDRLLDLVNQLLDFRKTETEGMHLTYVETNIPELLQKTYDRFSEAIKDKEIDFKMNMGEKDVSAFVDAEAFRKIAANLFGNAIKYAKKEVEVLLTADVKNFVLRIDNDGNLIPPHLRERIFEPFYRLTGSENQTGTGIGLALARSLTELHQGRLHLDTDNGKTNRFILELPLHQEKEFRLTQSSTETRERRENLPEEKPRDPVSIENGKSIILLVEDSEELLNFVAKELEVEYHIRKASNGMQALQILGEENIQLVISDVMMPGIDGFTLCKKIKTDLEISHIPVIMLTSKSAVNAKMEGLESGADAYIEKPFSMRHLKIHVANLLENRRHVLEHYSSSPLAHIKSIANTKTDETFIKKLDKVIYENMADHDLNVETLAEIMHMSRSTLYRKIRDISNLSPNELINITRLKKSAELIKTGKYKIFEVAEIVGYNSPTSFGRNFQKQFEMTPSEYMNGEKV